MNYHEAGDMLPSNHHGYKLSEIMKPQTIAIIGAGVAGLTAASLLKQSGHEVVIFDKFDAPKPLGAGLLLQPTGLSVLALLGLDEATIARGSPIHQLYGKVSGSRFTTLDVKYKDCSTHLFGVGTHRGALFASLHQKAIETGVKIISSSEITAIKQVSGKATLIDKAEQALGDYDLVIDASGQGSQLREKYASIRLNKPYPFGALWSLVTLEHNTFREDTLDQRYRRANNMIGVLPVGKEQGETKTSAAYFYSMPVADYTAFRSRPFNDWQQHAMSLWPETESLIKQFKSHDDLILATYRDVILNKCYQDNLVFIGDAAHCTSPQLGQGANLALLDAYILAETINRHRSISDALADYAKQRQAQTSFYQMASRALTPFFQSNSLFFAYSRFLMLLVSRKIPLTRRFTAEVLTGVKTGIFSKMNPGEWADKYKLL